MNDALVAWLWKIGCDVHSQSIQAIGGTVSKADLSMEIRQAVDFAAKPFPKSEAASRRLFCDDDKAMFKKRNPMIHLSLSPNVDPLGAAPCQARYLRW